MEDKNYPELFRAADKLAVKYQKRYYTYLFSYLILLIVGATIAFFEDSECWRITSLIVLVISLIVFLVSKLDDPQKLWYNGRAVAESVKTRTWRWMMSAHPYDYNAHKSHSEKFISDLQEILNENKALFKYYCEDREVDCEELYTISPRMNEVRGMKSGDKLDFYKRFRVNDQLRWYKSKARFNDRRYKLFCGLTIGLYILIIILAAINIKSSGFSKPIELLAVIASSFITWIESKKYNELANIYSLAKQDITLVKNQNINGQIGEEELSKYVINSENAFSREHTQWFAKTL